MSEHLIPLRRPGAEPGDHHELRARFEADPVELYGRYHEVEEAEAVIGVTRLTDGLHVDLEVSTVVRTTCDRTLEPTELRLRFGDSEFVPGPTSWELSVEDWTLDLKRYTERALPSEVPMQVFCPGTQRVEPPGSEDRIDPRWRGLDGLFASNL